MRMPEETEKNLGRDVIIAMHEHGVGCVPLTEAMMHIVRKAWLSGRVEGYKEAKDGENV